MRTWNSSILDETLATIGTILGPELDEITIEIGHRDDPFLRRQNGNIAGYVSRLMERLEIGRSALDPQNSPPTV